MTIKGKAYIGGVFEHPRRKIDDMSVAQLHAECAKGALDDAGLTFRDVDAYFCSGDIQGLGALSMPDYLGLTLRRQDSTDIGGSSYIYQLGHAAAAIAAGRAKVVLITCGGFGQRGTSVDDGGGPASAFEIPFAPVTVNLYAMAARRHMHQYGTTGEQLAWVKVAASHHARHNPDALLKKAVTVEEVLASPMIADPLHRMDCCVVTDSGGAVIVVSPEIAGQLKRPQVRLIGHGETSRGQRGGRIDLAGADAARSGPIAFAEAGVTPADIKYASIYDSFTIAVIEQLEDLGFCAKGAGGRFVMDGNLIAGVGSLPVNTDGGGLCNNHPVNRGGIIRIIEAVRQLRGEAHRAVQVKNCDIALVHGGGGSLGTRHGSSTAILERV